jgi:hypothetical protein
MKPRSGAGRGFFLSRRLSRCNVQACLTPSPDGAGQDRSPVGSHWPGFWLCGRPQSGWGAACEAATPALAPSSMGGHLAPVNVPAGRGFSCLRTIPLGRRSAAHKKTTPTIQLAPVDPTRRGFFLCSTQQQWGRVLDAAFCSRMMPVCPVHSTPIALGAGAGAPVGSHWPGLSSGGEQFCTDACQAST